MSFDHERYRSLHRSGYLGRRVQYVEETTSTMDDARAGAALEGDASPGTAYVGGRQTAGRGRQGRQWVSEPGVGLYVTYHLVPRSAAPTLPLFAAAGALAVGDAVRELTDIETAIKWPNDVLHGGRKLSGILAEARHGMRVDVFLGIGLNLRPAALPPEVRDIATSLEAAAGFAPSTEEMLAALSASLEHWSEVLESSPAEFVQRWRARLVTLGRRVRFALPDGSVEEGTARDVTATGDLVVESDRGVESQVAAGDVTIIG
ncbi:MAG: biotin--[acetyl-CoA-carboxylase] ligase [Dehalococcoidia bacterium]